MNLKDYIWIIVLAVSCIFSACDNTWDDHYRTNEADLSGVDIEIVPTSIVEYLKSTSDYSEIYGAFEKNGLLGNMDGEGLQYTVLVVKNAAWENKPGISEEQQLFTARTYASSLAISPANLTVGQTIKMWNGKLINIMKAESNIGIAFNGVKVTKVLKANNGYIYEVEEMIYTPQTMYEFVVGLGDEYSIFRDQILALEERIFDEANSTLTGVDAMGNNVYDSVWISKLPLFEDSYSFNMKSETLKGTVLIPTNKQIEDAIVDAKKRLVEFEWVREDTILTAWCYQSLFFNKIYEPADFQKTNPDEIDLTSLFGKQWRTTINKVDVSEPVELSNGKAYYVTDFRIPSNILMYRMKELMYHHYYLSEADKNTYYRLENFVLWSTPQVQVPAWSPGPEWPLVSNITQSMYLPTGMNNGAVYYKLHNYKDNGDGTYTITKRQLPPGEYDFFMGFRMQRATQFCGLKIYLNEEHLVDITSAQQHATNFDRYGALGPEGYDRRITTYDTDGIYFATVTVDSPDGKPRDLDFRFDATRGPGQDIGLHHMCFRPSKNFY